MLSEQSGRELARFKFYLEVESIKLTDRLCGDEEKGD